MARRCISRLATGAEVSNELFDQKPYIEELKERRLDFYAQYEYAV